MIFYHHEIQSRMHQGAPSILNGRFPIGWSKDEKPEDYMFALIQGMCFIPVVQDGQTVSYAPCTFDIPGCKRFDEAWVKFDELAAAASAKQIQEMKELAEPHIEAAGVGDMDEYVRQAAMNVFKDGTPKKTRRKR